MRNMRTVLRLMGTMVIGGTTITSVVACGSKEKPTPPAPDTRIDLKTIIPIKVLGQIMMVGSTPTKNY